MATDKSVSKIVRDILDQDPSLVHELQQRKTAQRDIAKKIKLRLTDSADFSVKDPVKLEGNVAVAITRYLKKLRAQQEELLGVKRVQSVLKTGTTEVIDGLKHYKIHIKETADSNKILQIILNQIQQDKLSSAYLSQNSVELYVKKMSENGFLKNISEQTGAKVTKLHDSLSQVKLMLPKQAAEIPGILAHVSSLLADQAISIFDTMVLHSENLVIVFVINELHASKARDILLKLNNENSSN
jgi:predicted regulator of amino acid metabolism with ACT domain